MMSNSRVTQTVTAKTEDSLFLSKLSKYLAVLIIFFGATQFGLHFWPSSTLVYGIRIDYLSPALYFLDCLILLFLGFDLLRKRPQGVFSRAIGETRSNLQSSMTAILPLLLTNLLYSQNPLATLSWSIHLILYICFVVTMGSDLKKIIAPIITFSLLFQTVLAATQVYLGHSVGGVMYYLGERMVSVGSPGIALGSFMDQVVLRAYGTFSHPNVLAGWLFVSLLIILKLTPTKKLIIGNWILLISTITTIVGVVLTQSRSAALALFAIIIPFYLIKNLKYTLIYFAVIVSMTYYLPSLILPTRSDLSSSQRLTLQGLSLSVIKTYPIFGTGAQSSISTYPGINSSVRLLQPDHNSFTLFLSWFGVFGLIGILYSLRPTTYNLRSLLPILPLLLFDHYLLTSPQGMFILTIYLVVIRLSGKPTI